jgi:hypothetical protein
VPKEKKHRKRPLGIFVYCDAEERKRLDRVRRFRHATWSGYMLEAALRQAELDEQEMRRRVPRN